DDTRTPEHLAIVNELGLRSAMMVPLIAHGRIVGSLNLMRGPNEPPYDEADLALAETLAGRAALAADNARLYQQAQQAVSLREQMLSIISHDLKNPITLIRGFAYSVRRQIKADSPQSVEVVHSLTEIDQAAERMNRLIDDLLDVSRLHQGRLEL